ncbi:MAG: NAD(P)/FAD-dependent oxidoreductase [Acidobacteriota bacterium]
MRAGESSSPPTATRVGPVSLQATIKAHLASHRPWDTMVVGAGPGGALAAHQLAVRGLSVLLVDRQAFPRRKVCGACLSASALSLLQRLGLGEIVGRLGGVRLHRLHLAGWSRHASIPLPPGASLSREAFDTALIRSAIEAGAEFLPRARASLLDCRADCRRVGLDFAGGRLVISARVVVMADGLASGFRAGRTARPAPALRYGAGAVSARGPAFYRPGTIYMAVGTGGYVGLVRLQDGRLNVAAAFDRSRLRRRSGPASSASEIIAEAGLPPIAGLRSLVWKGTPALALGREVVAAERSFAVGDAGGSIEPFTGEGIRWALSSAVSLAPLAHRAALAWDPSLADRWERDYRATVLRAQRPCRVLARLLRRPLLARLAIAAVAHNPNLAGPVIRKLDARPVLREAT